MTLPDGYTQWLPRSGSFLPKALFRRLFLETYTRKLLFGVFVGTHVPILALLVYLLMFADATGHLRWQLLNVVLAATLAGFGITLYVLHQLIAPIEAASEALQAYVDHTTIPDLPTHDDTLPGRLVANVQYTIEHVVGLTHSLEKAALYDYLTGCYTRRAGAQHLRNDIARAKRGEGMFSMALLDLDNFKTLNDRHGHAFGDRCLKTLTTLLSGRLRESDWLARWGGDEFVLVLWDVDTTAATEALTRLTRLLRATPCHTDEGRAVYLEASIGLCQFDGDGDENALLRNADRALYEAKSSNNGRIVTTTLPSFRMNEPP